jgi:hypothetical protein
LHGDGELELYRRCTERKQPPAGGANEAWLITGRRSGKSVILAVTACFLAVFRDWSDYLVPGERGAIKVMAADRRQARIIHRLCRALLLRVPALEPLVVHDSDDVIELTNDIDIEIQTASWRTIRGYTIVAALCDEIAYWRSDEQFANPDAEVLNALRPAMATVPGAMLLCASSPYARKGALWNAYKRHWGRDDAPALIWKAPTRTMNPTLSQRLVDEALEDDPAAAAAEYLAEFRTDIEAYITREVVEALIAPGRLELPPQPNIMYEAFTDPSGGSADSMTLAICHRERDGRAILDLVREIRPPFSPEEAVASFAEELGRYRVTGVTGDRYGAAWVIERFADHGIAYTVAEKPKSDIYREFLPLLMSKKLELLDHPRLAQQLVSLERRTARGGRDTIDHPPGAHDDIANAAAGVLVDSGRFAGLRNLEAWGRW